MTEDTKGSSSKPSRPFKSRLDPLASEELRAFVDLPSSRKPGKDTGDGESFLKARPFPPPAELFGRERDEGDDFSGGTLREIIEREEYQDTDKTLPLPMGVTIDGAPLIVGLEELPHLLVADITDSEKNAFVNSCIIGLCSMRRPDELKMLLLDSRQGEIVRCEKLPHILTPPVTDSGKAVRALKWAVREMVRRHSFFAESHAHNLTSYNEIVLPKDRLPHIVIVTDELTELIMTATKRAGMYIRDLAQDGHAAGIHLLLATQNSWGDAVPDDVMANIPARVAFKQRNATSSRTLIGTNGAEKLLGKRDKLFLSTQNPKPIRVQGVWIDEAAITHWLDYLVNLFGEPIYTDIEEEVGFSSSRASISKSREISSPPSDAPVMDSVADTGNQEECIRIMKNLVAQYGPDLYLNTKRLSGLVGDYFAADKRVKKNLLRAVADEVAAEIHALQGVDGDTLDFEIPRIMRKFIDENALIESTGRGAVICLVGGLLELPKDITNEG